MISTELLYYLNLDKAKHGDMIKALYDDYNRLNRLIYEMGVERDAIEFTLKNSYLKDTENLHFKDYESAVYYFEDLVGEIMLDWNSETKVKEVLTDFYIDGILYSPRFDGEKWSLGEDFIELFKLIKCGENDE